MRNHVAIQSNIFKENNVQLRLPVIVIDKQGVLKSYLDYLIQYSSSRSHSWISQSTQAIGLLLDYVNAHDGCFNKPFDMFVAFSNAQFTGTIDVNGDDASGLRWKPRSIQSANKIISYVTQYTDWLSIKNENASLQLNPYREATKYEEKLNWAAYLHKKNNAFLAHTWSNTKAKEENSKSREVRYAREDQTDGSDDKVAFPESRIYDLLDIGFIRPRSLPEEAAYNRLELRDILITLLLHFGGLRRSEPFHIWVEDVMSYPDDPECAMVRVYHPKLGLSPKHLTGGKKETRKITLAKKFQRLPRDEYPKSKKVHAGWKDPMLNNKEGKYFDVFWFDPSAGKLFWYFWNIYIKSQRVPPSEGKAHPYAFTNKYGDPYSIDSYKKRHKRAIESLDLPYGKYYGTTPHSHRHSYGTRLRQANVDPMFMYRNFKTSHTSK